MSCPSPVAFPEAGTDGYHPREESLQELGVATPQLMEKQAVLPTPAQACVCGWCQPPEKVLVTMCLLTLRSAHGTPSVMCAPCSQKKKKASSSDVPKDPN